MDIQTHQRIDTRLCGRPLGAEDGGSRTDIGQLLGSFDELTHEGK
jgi:hypothetical protein